MFSVPYFKWSLQYLFEVFLIISPWYPRGNWRRRQCKASKWLEWNPDWEMLGKTNTEFNWNSTHVFEKVPKTSRPSHKISIYRICIGVILHYSQTIIKTINMRAVLDLLSYPSSDLIFTPSLHVRTSIIITSLSQMRRWASERLNDLPETETSEQRSSKHLCYCFSLTNLGILTKIPSGFQKTSVM